MTIFDAVENRRSVRKYIDKPIEDEKIQLLNEYIAECNKESDLNIQLIINEEKAFGNSILAHYGKFSGVKNYLALVGKKRKDFQEILGYYGEKIVLYAKTIGLDTCWVALTYKKVKSTFKINKGEKLLAVISIGYGEKVRASRKTKTIYQVSNANNSSPKWFIKGVEFALKAPTAMNQQKFYIQYINDNLVKIKAGLGFYAKTDLGIVKYHFELGASNKNIKLI